MRPLRVALCADFPEEQWPSMDRVADRLATYLRRDHGQTIEITPVVPRFTRRATFLSGSQRGRAFMLDRLVNRLWDYPRHVSSLASDFDVFHVIDHSYAQLVHRLPADRTVVTCHDLDTFRSLLRPQEERRSRPYNAMMRHVLAGLRRAARVTCDTAAVRDELVANRLVEPERAIVAPVAVGPEFSRQPDREADDAAGRLAGVPADVPVLLHVGSTIPRKRIDVLLKTFAALLAVRPNLVLVRVGGGLTPEQTRLAGELGILERIVTPGFLDDRTLAAMYRRAALVLLPSDREGFGLPLVEAMACGTPIIASDLTVLREVGGTAVEYCPVGAVSDWRQRVLDLLAEREGDPRRRAARVEAGLARAVRFTWPQFAASLAGLYRELAPRAAGSVETAKAGTSLDKARPMKVVHAAKFYPPVPGGMEAFVETLAAGTAGDWESVVVAAHTASQGCEERIDGVRVVRAGALGVVASVPLCPSLPLALWRERADCVVLHEPNPISGSSMFLHTPAKRLIIWHHSDLVRPWWAIPTYGRLQRALYRRADCVIVSNPVLAERSPLVKCARRVAVIPHGVDLPRYATLTAAQSALAERLRTGIGGPRFLFVGRFVYYKGLDVLVDALSRCAGTLLLVGDGPLLGDLRQQVARLGLQSRVVFAGSVSDQDLPAYYHASDVFVLPSVAESETYGLVQIEAMASGVPVVSTSLPTGVPWVNQHDVTGMVVPPRDVTALAAALSTLGGDAARRRVLGDGGRRRAEAMFSRERTVQLFRQLVETTVHAPGLLDEQLPQVESA